MAIRALDGANKNTNHYSRNTINILHSYRPIWDEAVNKVVECTNNPEWQPSDGPSKMVIVSNFKQILSQVIHPFC